MSSTPVKRRWWKTALKASVFLVALFVLLTVIAASVFSYLGRRDWAAMQAELAARGELLSLAAIWPPPIPEQQNFYADPLWMELADLVEVEKDFEGQKFTLKQIRLPMGERQIDGLNPTLTPDQRELLSKAFPGVPVSEDSTVAVLVREAYESRKNSDPHAQREAAAFILAVLAQSKPVLTRLENLASRPGAHFPLAIPDLAALSDRTSYLFKYSQFLKARAWAELELGNPSAAYRDVMTLLRLPDLLSSEPLLISLLVSIPMGTFALEAVEEGLKANAWTDAELEAIEHHLAKLDFPSIAASSLRGERAFGNQFLEELEQTPENERSASQKAWSSRLASPWMWMFGAGDQAFRNKMFQNMIDVLDKTPQEGLNARTFSVFDRDVTFLKGNPWNRFRYAVSGTAIPNLNNFVRASANLQDKIQQARTACALERFHRKHAEYPESLSSLVPGFMTSVPLDVATAGPLSYQREGKGYRLWTPGWDEKNEGNSADDWIWAQPAMR